MARVRKKRRALRRVKGNNGRRRVSPARRKRTTKRGQTALVLKSPEYRVGGKELDFATLCRRFSYASLFPKAAEQEAEKLKQAWQTNREEFLKRRRDCRSALVVTIDPETARDFDDAVALEEIFSSGEKVGYRLAVHVADVSAWVGEGSVLDQVAFSQGTSVYLLDKTLPMLPETLSGNLASLQEGEERLAFSCFMDLDLRGELSSFTFEKTVITVKKRLTYQQVEAVLQKKSSLGASLDAQLFLMERLKELLYRKRIAEGAIAFERPEAVFTLCRGEITACESRARLESERIIEEFMLAANWCAALFMKQNKIGIFRVHQSPAEEKKRRFLRQLHHRGYALKQAGSENPLKEAKRVKNRFQIFLAQLQAKKTNGQPISRPPSSSYSQLLEALRERQEKEWLTFSLLTTMQQAEYSTLNVGHYGLAFSHYTHFTSPLRRYPDLVVHRIIFSLLTKSRKRVVGYSKKKLQLIARHSSFQERQAVAAEREYKKVKLIRYLHSRWEDDFFCFIRELGPRGLYLVELQTGLEGMVPLRSLNKELFYEAEQGELVDYLGRVYYRPGELLKARLARLDLSRLFVAFKLLEEKETPL